MSTNKRVLVLTLVLLSAMATIPFFAAYANADRQVGVTIDGQQLVFEEQEPVVQGNHLLVPVREVFEHLGFDVTWNNSLRMARLEYDGMVIIIPENTSSFVVNNRIITPDVQQRMIDGRMMMPLRAVTEAVGGTVQWSSGNRVAEVFIHTSPVATPIPESTVPTPSIAPQPTVAPTPIATSAPIPVPTQLPIPLPTPEPTPQATVTPTISPSPAPDSDVDTSLSYDYYYEYSPASSPVPADIATPVASPAPGVTTTQTIPPVANFQGRLSPISGGRNHSMAITSDGRLFGWGSNFSGQLGDGTISTARVAPGGGHLPPGTASGPGNNDRSTPVYIMSNVLVVHAAESPPSFPEVQGARENSLTFAITSDNNLWAWGGGIWDWHVHNMTTSATRNAQPTVDTTRPVHIMDNVLEISSRYYYTFVIRTDNTLWGWAPHGNVIGAPEGTTGITHLMDNVVSVAAGENHVLAIDTNGTLWAWGNNDFGQLGDGTTYFRNSPVRILENVMQVSAGVNHSMAITTDGRLWGWGINRGGQVGDGTLLNRHQPTHIKDNVVAISAGIGRTLSITEDGAMWGWGSHMPDGNGGIIERLNMPRRIMENIAYVCTTNGSHLMAVSASGDLWTWGLNRYAQLGNDSFQNSHVFIPVLENMLLP